MILVHEDGLSVDWVFGRIFHLPICKIIVSNEITLGLPIKIREQNEKQKEIVETNKPIRMSKHSVCET